jgi:hypothetical protein
LFNNYFFLFIRFLRYFKCFPLRKPEESFRTEIELKPEDETTEEIFKESIEIEKKPELEEVKLDITVDKTITDFHFD